MSNRKRHAAQEAPREETPPPPAYPAHWVPGQLLDLRHFTDGSFRATVMGEEYDPQAQNALTFESSFHAQQFISRWYSREQQQR